MSHLTLMGAGGAVAVGNETYSGATIAPVGDDSDNGIAHLAFSGQIIASSYTDGWTLQSREPGGTWATITSWTGTLHGDGNKIIATLTGTVDTWQGSHEFRASYDGSGDLNVDAFTNNATVTNQSTVDWIAKMTEWWTLDEAANGVRAAQVSSPANDLSDTNNVAQGTGGDALIGNSADFDGGDALDAGDVLDPPGDGIFSVAAWFLMDVLPGANNKNAYVISKWSGTNDRSFNVYVARDAGANQNKLYAGGQNANDGGFTQLNDDRGVLSAGVYYGVVAVFNPGGTIGIQSYTAISGTPGSYIKETTALTGTGTGDPQCKVSGASTIVGHSTGMPAWASLDGPIDLPHWFTGALSDAEAEDWLNDGDAKQYPAIPT